MVKQSVRVTKSDEHHITEVKIGNATLKLRYDMAGFLSFLESDKRITPEIANLIGVITQDWINLANVQTRNADNIMIDKLTQGAYTERRSTLSNDGAATGWYGYGVSDRKGKFFPRGARGFIGTVNVECRDDAVAGGTLTVYLSPNMGLSYIATATIAVPPSGGAAYRSATFNIQWNYDSLFIAVSSSTTNVPFAWDAGNPPDWWSTGDGGITWVAGPYRPHFRANYQGETCGDVPVSGTINNIPIPAQSSRRATVSGFSVPNGIITSICSAAGAGTTLFARIALGTTVAPTAAIVYGIFLKADDQYAYELYNFEVTQSDTAIFGRCSVGEFLQRAAPASYTILSMRVSVQFKKKIELLVYQNTGGAVDVDGFIYASMLT